MIRVSVVLLFLFLSTGLSAIAIHSPAPGTVSDKAIKDFGNALVENSYDSKMKSVVDGRCKLYNQKSDDYKYKGNCKIKQRIYDGKNEYIIELGNGNTYYFVKRKNGYKVKTPNGWSNNFAVITDYEYKAVFEWGKWELTAKEKQGQGVSAPYFLTFDAPGLY